MANVSQALKPKAHDEELHNGLDAGYCGDMAERLSEVLAAAYKLTIKNHIYHWNVVGPLFKPLHELTEEHYQALFAAVDVIAERIRALGHLAPVTLGDAAKFAPDAKSVNNTSAIDMISDLIAENEAAVRLMRPAAEKADEAGDLVTSDMLTERMEFHEKAIWMLRAIAAN